MSDKTNPRTGRTGQRSRRYTGAASKGPNDAIATLRARTMKAGYAYAWEFTARPDKLEEFKRIYGQDGDWVKLFRRASGYLRSELMQDQANPWRFVTVDYWESEAAWLDFRQKFLHEYENLDVICEQVTIREREIGRFSPL